jgi:hypothetical protein
MSAEWGVRNAEWRSVQLSEFSFIPHSTLRIPHL